MLRKKIFFLTPFNDVDLHMSSEFVTFDVGELEASGSTEVVQERVQKNAHHSHEQHAFNKTILLKNNFKTTKEQVGCARFERAKVPKYHLIYHEVHLSYLTCAIFFGNTQMS